MLWYGDSTGNYLVMLCLVEWSLIRKVTVKKMNELLFLSKQTAHLTWNIFVGIKYFL